MRAIPDLRGREGAQHIQPRADAAKVDTHHHRPRQREHSTVPHVHRLEMGLALSHVRELSF